MKKTKEIEKYLAFRKKLRVLKLAKDLKSSRKAYEIFDISKSTFYSWKKKFDEHGEQGLVRKKRPLKMGLALCHLQGRMLLFCCQKKVMVAVTGKF